MIEFRITRHRGTPAAPPPDAVELLWPWLGTRRNGVAFAKVGSTIRARDASDLPVSMTLDERAPVARSALEELVRAVCDEHADLRWEWYAIDGGAEL